MAKKKVQTSGFVPSSGGQGTPGTSFGQAQAAPTSPREQALAILNRQSTRLGNLEQLAQAATTPTPLSRVEERAATAEARGLVAQTTKDLQRDNVALAQSRASTTSANAANAAAAAEALKAQQEAARVTEEKRRAGQSAYDLLFNEFSQYGMGALIEPLKAFIQDGISPSEFTLRLRGTDAYKKRFAANTARIAKGLSALSEAEYIGLEDQYQNIMRNYGLPATYYARGEMGRQEGFEKFLANDVSAIELEDRIATAQKRVINANPEVSAALRQFYPDINTSDILAFTLDPEKGLEGIKRKVTAAEIGGAAVRSGLTTNVSDAEYLQRYGVTKESAEQGYTTIASGLQRGSQLASIYQQDPYTQAVAETEVFNVPGAQEARKQRQRITGLERAAFSGQTGLTAGALTRDRAGGY
jgi:hypothetical protein